MIEIINSQKKYRFNRGRLDRLFENLTKQFQVKDSYLTLVLAGTKRVRALNRKYRQQDKATDVLSFPLREKNPDGCFYLGDIIIAVPEAAKQARQKGHSLERELNILCIHGFLHLLGYDHEGGRIERVEKKLYKDLSI